LRKFKVSQALVFPLLAICLQVFASEEKSNLPATCADLTMAIVDPSAPRTSSWKHVPAIFRRTLAKVNPKIKKEHIDVLLAEVRELIPPEAAAWMAYIPQTSHDYLLGELPKKESFVDENGKFDSKKYDDHKAEWGAKSIKAIQKLREVRGLLQADPQSDERDSLLATIHLSLGIILGFTYGFEAVLVHGVSAWQTAIIPADGPFLKEATESYQSALEIFNRLGANKKYLTLIQFLLGKHAQNGIHAHSNGGIYKFDGTPMLEDSEAHEYLNLADTNLKEVVESLSSSAGFNPILFEAKFHLIEVGLWPNRFLVHRHPELMGRDNIEYRNKLEMLFSEFLASAPKSWVEKDMKSSYGITLRLVNHLRWAYQDEHGSPLWSALWSVGDSIRRGGSITYDEMLSRLRPAGLSKPQLLENGRTE
jgi:hypothetical protein